MPDLIVGWRLQQLVKLEALARMSCDAVVFLDSDMVMCRPVVEQDYWQDGRLRLLESGAHSFEDYAFGVSTQILVGGDLSAPARSYNYIHPTARFQPRTAVRLLAHLRATHKDWHRRMLREAFLSEYNLLGYAARELEGYEGYVRDPLSGEAWYYDVRRSEALQAELAACHQERGKRQFILIQSNMGVPASIYAARVEKLLNDLAELPQQ